MQPAVGCGAFILRDGGLLLIRRVKAPEAGCWGLPGGKVDPFETTAQAAMREVREEVGLELQAGPLLCVVDQIDRAVGTHWVAPVYTVGPVRGEPYLCEPHKHDGLGWFALDALPHPLTVATQVAVQAFNALAK
ncbi:NUDIX domain-containing protein [Acetobacter lambici]|uniref:NUDIX domain-containing protein n=1 Tax=Acetobacter lambici TaxID=1332824 RepID=A0ABT1EXN2_9PROT|nr:NUDIX domain-containing protein [Acetobacter lambici]MCP1241580.1 NUDIX domain-containing protein [Acetobacter lambici]MCP1257700.1 NUDIX domain-containing protein [Acetobacter lambici]NHO56203.1 NUDIX domain-containing protein [Acetobacter lambici]